MTSATPLGRHVLADPADDDGELALVVDLGGLAAACTTGSPGPTTAVFGLRNISGSAGGLAAHLGGVVGVVAADADHLAARDDRRQQPHVVERHLHAGEHDRLVERVTLDLGDELVPGPPRRCRRSGLHLWCISRCARHEATHRRVPFDPVVVREVRQVMEQEWRSLESAHAARVDALTAGHLTRRADARRHPVADFLFTYYSHRPAQLRRWHPGPGVALAGAVERSDWRCLPIRRRRSPSSTSSSCWPHAASSVRFIRDLLAAHRGRVRRSWAASACTSGRWSTGRSRSRSGTRTGRCGSAARAPTAVVEQHRIRCSHFDAYRFFTPPARPLNVLTPTREAQPALEQPGCLHANMDLYKWAYKLSPGVPSDLTLDCFELAREVRELDMRAAPYDLRELGVRPGADRDQRGQGGVRRRAAGVLAAGADAARPAGGSLRRPAQRRSSTLARPAHACSSVNPSSTCCSGPHPRLAACAPTTGYSPSSGSARMSSR